MPIDEQLLSITSKLIEDSHAIERSKFETEFSGLYVDIREHGKWTAGCRNILHMIGPRAAPFAESFNDTNGKSTNAYGLFLRQLGTLQSLRNAIQDGLLVSIKDLVFAEAFSDLIEQAEELANKGYFLAAGVICRAVFEEHLRKLCDLHSCLPEGKPTIETLKQALVKMEVLTKVDAKNADAITGEGNHCAHNNQPPLDEAAIRGLIQKVITFLSQHPLK